MRISTASAVVVVLILLEGCRFDGGGAAGPLTAAARPGGQGGGAGSQRADAAPSGSRPALDTAAAEIGIAAVDTAVGVGNGSTAGMGSSSLGDPSDAGFRPTSDVIVADALSGPIDSGAPSPVDTAPAPTLIDPRTGCPSDPTLAVCLRFEGDLKDESPSALAVESRSVRFERGPSGLAIDVGPQSRIILPDSPLLDAPTITIEAQVNARPLTRRMGVIENPGQYGLYVLPSGSVMCSGRGGYALRSDAITPGRWTHLLCTFDDTSIALWVDGTRVAMGAGGPVATDRSDGLRIGWEDEPGRHFDGLIDNVRVWRSLRLR